MVVAEPPGEWRGSVARIRAERKFALSQAVVSGDLFERGPSECGQCLQDFLAELDPVICLEKLRDWSRKLMTLFQRPIPSPSGVAGCTLFPPARPCGPCCGSGQQRDPLSPGRVVPWPDGPGGRRPCPTRW